MPFFNDAIKAGPLTREDMLSHIAAHYPDVNATALVDRATASVTGMAATPLNSGHALWVSALFTRPGEYMLEEDEILR